ncbi:MAG: hypothetical protein QM683_20435 [Lacrimispora sp.]
MSTFECRIAELLAMKLESLVSAKVERNTNEGEKTILDSSTIPQFTEDLPIPDVYDPVIINRAGKTTHAYAVDVSEFQEQILPHGYPQTTVYGYGGVVKDRKQGSVSTNVLHQAQPLRLFVAKG